MTKSIDMQEKISQIKDFICDTITDRGYPPTVREICSEFEIKSTSSAAYYLKKLEDAGELKINKLKSRGIEVTGRRVSNKDVIEVPLVGSITAGAPKLAVEDSDDTYYIPGNLFRHCSGDVFMLNVIGTSMIEIGIKDGDIILVKQQNTANNGQVIVALVEDECATVKRYFNDGQRVWLHPENKDMQDIYPTELTILGVVIGLIRTDIH